MPETGSPADLLLRRMYGPARPETTAPREADTLDQDKLVLNERAKLFATFINAIASGMATIGTVTPIAAWFFILPAAPDLAPGRLFLGALIWFIMAGGVHSLASLVLGAMRP